jgi:hypothetical protein
MTNKTKPTSDTNEAVKKLIAEGDTGERGSETVQGIASRGKDIGGNSSPA